MEYNFYEYFKMDKDLWIDLVLMINKCHYDYNNNTVFVFENFKIKYINNLLSKIRKSLRDINYKILEYVEIDHDNLFAGICITTNIPKNIFKLACEYEENWKQLVRNWCDNDSMETVNSEPEDNLSIEDYEPNNEF